MRIGEILEAKPRHDVVTIAPTAGVRELVALLAEHNIGAVVVADPAETDEQGVAMLGIVSERDVVRHLHHDGTVVNNTVRAIMTASVETCSPDDELDEVMATMTRRRFRHVPVLDGARLVGVVSIGDVVKHKIDRLEFERDQLDSYVNQA